jgi:hypothetical protein
MRTLSRLASGLVLSGLLLAPVSEARTRIYVNIGPPPVVVERHVVASPGRGYIWQDGYQMWNGHRYVWVAGRWVRPPHRHSRWSTGTWRQTTRGYYYTPGYWR